MVLLSTEVHNDSDEGEIFWVRLGLFRLAVTGHPYSLFLVQVGVSLDYADGKGPTMTHKLNRPWFCWTTTVLPLVSDRLAHMS